MGQEQVARKSLDNQEFLQLRKATEKIADALEKRLKNHLSVLRPLFVPRKLFGSYIKSSSMQDVPGADKAFAELQEHYAAVCGGPFELPKKLPAPLAPISNHLEGTPLQYTLHGGANDKETKITCPTKWVLSYRSECPLTRLHAMISGKETRQPEDMRQALIDHLAIVVFLEHYPALTSLFEDLRYHVETRELPEFGGLPVIILKAPVQTFLPPDDFIQQVTQLSGIPAFQEIVEQEALKDIPDPLREDLIKAAAEG
ncbi:MAG: hypothetical protein JRI36_02365 [Deltaproteobacteria bacterium]|nr:hypothetical protein [Deltaproteobacteria bacterium]